MIRNIDLYVQIPGLLRTSTKIPGLSRPGIQIFKFQDFPGFQGPVRTLYKLGIVQHSKSKQLHHQTFVIVYLLPSVFFVIDLTSFGWNVPMSSITASRCWWLERFDTWIRALKALSISISWSTSLRLVVPMISNLRPWWWNEYQIISNNNNNNMWNL